MDFSSMLASTTKQIAIVAAISIGLLISTARADDLRIDGTTKESFVSSTQAIAKSLTPEEQQAFHKGMMNLIITRYPPAAGARGLQLIPFMGPAAEAAHITMNGVTKSEILAKGRELIAADAMSTPNYEGIRSCVQRNVAVSKAHIKKTDFGSNIELNVTNNLPWAISFVHVGYKITTLGRSVPWSDDNFGMDVSGGIEPGETRTITTNVFSVPATAKDLSVSAQILDVADSEKRSVVGETLFLGHPKETTPFGCK